MAKDSKKIDDTTGGIKSISKSARTKAARQARAAKAGYIPGLGHGGACSSCGQRSSSCTTGSVHSACTGFYEGEFPGFPILSDLSAKGFHFMANGTQIFEPIQGTWIEEDTLLRLRREREAETFARLKNQVILTSVFETVDDGKGGTFEKVTRVDAVNGLGDPISCVNGQWSVITERIEEMLVDTGVLEADSFERLLSQSVQVVLDANFDPNMKLESSAYADAMATA